MEWIDTKRETDLEIRHNTQCTRDRGCLYIKMNNVKGESTTKYERQNGSLICFPNWQAIHIAGALSLTHEINLLDTRGFNTVSVGDQGVDARKIDLE